MKRLLLIAYHYYQKEASATVRTTGWIKYLPEFGWDITLLTSQNFKSNNISSPNIISIKDNNLLVNLFVSMGYESPEYTSEKPTDSIFLLKLSKNQNIKSVYNMFMSISKKIVSTNSIQNLKGYIMSIYYPDIYGAWKKQAIQNGLKELEAHSYDAILSTSGPISAHYIANELQKCSGLPWIADYRDLWSLLPHNKYNLWRVKIDKRFEKKILATASYITSVSEPLAHKLKAFHGIESISIPNGFDPEDINKEFKLRNKFTITYTGSLTNTTFRDPEPLFKAISELILENNIILEDIDIRFYGPKEGWVEQEIHDYGLEKCVAQYGIVTKEISLFMQRSSQILLFLMYNGPNPEGVLSGKLYEYFGSRRPILAIGARGSGVESILETTKSGIHLNNVDSIKGQILLWYHVYKQYGYLPYEGDMKEIDKYSHKEMAKKFASILNLVTKP